MDSPERLDVNSMEGRGKSSNLSACAPRAPRTLDETGLPFLFLVELLIKVLFLRGSVQLIDLSLHIKLNISVLDPLITFIRGEKLCQASRTGASGTDADLVYQLTELGRARGMECLRRNSYAGAAPVSLAAYCAQVDLQSVADMHVAREDMDATYHDVVVDPEVLEQLGVSMNSGRAVFIYGPAGGGKTYLGERLSRLLKGSIYLPHAIMIDGEVIQMYDPVVHCAMDEGIEPAHSSHSRSQVDARWVLSARPAVLTGGELTLDMLDLRFDFSTRFYQAPPHLKANNGIFIVDDFGRQRCSAVELMNRWIVPMDRRVDYLSLHTGHKFRVPFDVIVFFSSNLPPAKLADASFLRRLGYKIYVGPLTEEEYQRVFIAVCAQYGVPFSIDAFNYLLHEHHYKEDRALLACYPGDIVSQVRDIAVYEGRVPCLDSATLDWAWNNYFTGT